MEIKIKWIKRKQMTHENTYRDDNIMVQKNPNNQHHSQGLGASEKKKIKIKILYNTIVLYIIFFFLVLYSIFFFFFFFRTHLAPVTSLGVKKK